jgi:hypothetical protein
MGGNDERVQLEGNQYTGAREKRSFGSGRGSEWPMKAEKDPES